MKILFSSTAGLGHLLPLVPIARAARNAGYQVQVLTDAKHAAGWLTSGSSSCPRRRLRRGPGTGLRAADPVDVQPAPRRSSVALIRGRARTRSVFRDWRPDVVVSEAAEFPAGLVAETEGLPVVRVHPGQAGLDIWDGWSARRSPRSGVIWAWIPTLTPTGCWTPRRSAIFRPSSIHPVRPGGGSGAERPDGPARPGPAD